MPARKLVGTDPETYFITTDLDLRSHRDLEPLVEVFDTERMFATTNSHFEERCLFQASTTDSRDPELSIAPFLDLIEGLTGDARALYESCSHRVLDLGFQAGIEPFSLKKDLSAATMRRAADLGLDIRITIYRFEPNSVARMVYDGQIQRLATRAAVTEFYERASELFGIEGLQPHHEARAQVLRRRYRPPQRVLELGAGNGGTALEMARLGYDVTSIELASALTSYARKHRKPDSKLDIREGDFYTDDLGTGYDIVTYWNGFGEGTDQELRSLLRRVGNEWLRPGGIMILEVFHPYWWSRQPRKPQQVPEHGAVKKTTFNRVSNCFLEKWWPKGKKNKAVERVVRCFSPADLELLCEGTGLVFDLLEIGTPAKSPTYLAMLRRITTGRTLRMNRPGYHRSNES